MSFIQLTLIIFTLRVFLIDRIECADVIGSNRLIGGARITITDAPYVVHLQHFDNIVCGGTLVTSKHVVTAAHCVYYTYARDLTVIGGTTYLNRDGIRRKVAKIRISMLFDYNTKNYDVAVVQLKRSMIASNIQPIPLCNSKLNIGEPVKVYGWGVVHENIYVPSIRLRTIEISLIGRKDCQRRYDGYSVLTDTMFCAAQLGKGSCRGDSGGPLIYNNQLCGVVSWGYGCGRPNYPGIYTSINFVKEFIKMMIRYD